MECRLPAIMRPAACRQDFKNGRRREGARRLGPDWSHHEAEAAATGPGFPGPTWRKSSGTSQEKSKYN